MPYNVYMKNKQMIVMVDEEFLEKVDYIEKINGYKNKSDAVRKTIEKEYRKEITDKMEKAIIKAFEKRGCKMAVVGKEKDKVEIGIDKLRYPRNETYCKACPYLNTLDCRIYGKGIGGEVGCTLDSRK